MATDQSELLRILNGLNPWWRTGSVPKPLVQDYRRRDYHEASERIRGREVLSLIGARRVGKTTIMYQLIDDLLKATPPRNILLLRGDDPYLNFKGDSARRSLELYSGEILEKRLEEAENVYVFIDEVQAIPDWELLVKRWYDTSPGIKFIVSGSSSTQIQRGSAESLVGRLHPMIIQPFRFIEAVKYRHRNEVQLLEEAGAALRDGFLEGIDRGEPERFHEAAEKASLRVSAYYDELSASLRRYLLVGGYPEIQSELEASRINEKMRDYISLMVYRDIVKTYRIRDPGAFESLLRILSVEGGHRLNTESLAAELGMKKDSVRNYIYYLTAAFLLQVSHFYTRNLRKQERYRKIYFNDPGIRNAEAGFLTVGSLDDPQWIGLIAENVAACHIRRLRCEVEGGADQPLFFWFDSKGEEVDVVQSFKGKAVPFEVKYRENVGRSDLAGIRRFSTEFKCRMSVVITRRDLKLEGEAVYVPLWLFLLMC